MQAKVQERELWRIIACIVIATYQMGPKFYSENRVKNGLFLTPQTLVSHSFGHWKKQVKHVELLCAVYSMEKWICSGRGKLDLQILWGKVINNHLPQRK